MLVVHDNVTWFSDSESNYQSQKHTIPFCECVECDGTVSDDDDGYFVLHAGWEYDRNAANDATIYINVMIPTSTISLALKILCNSLNSYMH